MQEAANRIDFIIYDAVFGSEVTKNESRQRIGELASDCGVYPASIQGFYKARGRGRYSGITVPAINIRGITYDVARAVFRVAIKDNVGAFIFEIARSEIGYTAQRPAEYMACILAAAVKEGFKGPVFVQGDHFQVNAGRYETDSEKELNAIKQLTQEAVDAGFFNIDIDASTIVNLDKPTLEEQQELNCRVTADMTEFIRGIEPEGTTVSIGGEIGEVGGRNSTVEDLQSFMSGYLRLLSPGTEGISKISVQTGTAHGGVVLPDGSIADVKLDFNTLEQLSRVARSEYGMGGAVQHGASTLPDEAFDKFAEVDTLEVHLATGFQNIIYDSPHFPSDLRDEIYSHLLSTYAAERKQNETEEQFIYKTRKKAFGDFKQRMWGLPQENLDRLREALEERFSPLFHKLNVVNTTDIIAKHITTDDVL